MPRCRTMWSGADSYRKEAMNRLCSRVSPRAARQDMVDPANSDWNLLLVDLRKLSAIVENEEEENTAYERPAAPTVRQKQPESNHPRLWSICSKLGHREPQLRVIARLIWICRPS